MESNDFALAGSRALEARDRLTTLSRLPTRDEHRMAEIGTTALFEEALLGALRAHFGELKIISR